MATTNLLQKVVRALTLIKNIVIYKTKIMRKGIGPRNLGASPLKQKNDRKKEYNNLTERFENFDRSKDTLIIGRSNSTSGATFGNNQKRQRAIDQRKMKRQVKKSVMLNMGNGQFKYVTQHEKK
jgi:hypothetical protein